MNSFVKKTLTEKEQALFIDFVTGNTTMLPILKKLIECKLSELGKPANEKDLLNASWPLIRAHRDGGEHYLTLLLTMLKEQK